MARRGSAGTKKRIVVGITGASGAVYGVRLLERLRAARGWETHLVLTESGVLTAWQELGMHRAGLERDPIDHIHSG